MEDPLSRKILTLLVTMALSVGVFLFASGVAWAKEDVPQVQQHAQKNNEGISIVAPVVVQPTEVNTTIGGGTTDPVTQTPPPTGTPPPTAEPPPPTETTPPTGGTTPPTKAPPPVDPPPEQTPPPPIHQYDPPPEWGQENNYTYEPYYAYESENYIHQPYYVYDSLSDLTPQASNAAESAPRYETPYQYPTGAVATEPASDQASLGNTGSEPAQTPEAAGSAQEPTGGSAILPGPALADREPAFFEEGSKPLPAPSPPAARAGAQTTPHGPLDSGKTRASVVWNSLPNLPSAASSVTKTLQSAAANIAHDFASWFPTESPSSAGTEGSSGGDDSQNPTPPPYAPIAPAPPGGGYLFSLGGGHAGGGGIAPLILLGVLASAVLLPYRNGKLWKYYCDAPKISSTLLTPLERPG